MIIHDSYLSSIPHHPLDGLHRQSSAQSFVVEKQFGQIAGLAMQSFPAGTINIFISQDRLLI
jgi:hypothetical protein